MVNAVAWLALLTPGGVGAQPPPPAVAAPYELRWMRAPGAEGCIGAYELAGVVSARVGRQVFDGPGATAARIDGEVRPAGAGWHVRITIRGPDGVTRGARELELEGGDCRMIDEPLALVLALIVDPDAGWGAPPDPAPVAPRTTWRADAAVTGAAAIGVVPGATGGVRIAITIDGPEMWPIALGGAWWAPGEETDAGGAQAVRLNRWQASAAICTPARRLGGAALAGCGGAAIGRIEARGVGFDRNQATGATMAMATLGGRATVGLRAPAFAVAELGLEVPLVRPRFVDDAGMSRHQVAPASVFAALGVGVRF